MIVHKKNYHATYKITTLHISNVISTKTKFRIDHGFGDGGKRLCVCEIIWPSPLDFIITLHAKPITRNIQTFKLHTHVQ